MPSRSINVLYNVHYLVNKKLELIIPGTSTLMYNYSKYSGREVIISRLYPLGRDGG
jgi:hypothetical protein